MIPFLRLAAQPIAASAGGCFHRHYVLRKWRNQVSRQSPCVIVNANDSGMRVSEKVRVTDRVRFAIQESTKRQDIGNQIDAGFIFGVDDLRAVLRSFGL